MGWARAATLAAAGVLVAGCAAGSGHSCGMCDPTIVAVGSETLWVAQGRTVSRFTTEGRLLGRTEVLPARRSSGVQAIAVDADHAVVGWSGAVAGVLPSGAVSFRRVRRPPGYVFGMETVEGRTWLAAGRRAIALAPDGTIRMRPRLPARATGLAAGDGVVWVVGGRVKGVKIAHRGWTAVPAGPGYAIALDARTGRRVRALATPPGPSAVAVWRDRLWIESASGLDQLDATTGRVLNHADSSGEMIAAGEGWLWSLSTDGTLTRRSPEDGAPSGSTVSLNQYVGSLTTGAGAVWVGGGVQDTDVFRIDPAVPRVVWRESIPPT